MEIAEPEEGLLEGGTPIRVEKLSDVGGGGEVESIVVGLEMAVDHFDMDGELRKEGIVHGGSEQRKEGIVEGVEPVGVVILEGTRGFLAAKQT